MAPWPNMPKSRRKRSGGRSCPRPSPPTRSLLQKDAAAELATALPADSFLVGRSGPGRRHHHLRLVAGEPDDHAYSSSSEVTAPSDFVNPYGQTAFIVGASDKITIDGSGAPGLTISGNGKTGCSWSRGAARWPAASIATGWNDSCRVAITPTEDRTPLHGAL
jgi:hypothetical protein